MASFTVFLGARLRRGTVTYACVVGGVGDRREAFEAAMRRCDAELGVPCLSASFRYGDAQIEAMPGVDRLAAAPARERGLRPAGAQAGRP